MTIAILLAILLAAVLVCLGLFAVADALKTRALDVKRSDTRVSLDLESLYRPHYESGSDWSTSVMQGPRIPSIAESLAELARAHRVQVVHEDDSTGTV